MQKLSILFLIVLFSFACSQKEPVLFEDGLEDFPTLERVLDSVDKYQVQILFTQIDRNEHMNPMM